MIQINIITFILNIQNIHSSINFEIFSTHKTRKEYLRVPELISKKSKNKYINNTNKHTKTTPLYYKGEVVFIFMNLDRMKGNTENDKKIFNTNTEKQWR